MASKPRKNTKPENHNLLSKADIAEMLNISSQLLANKASRAAERGEYFPEPTYSNQSGTVTLYTIEDAKEVYEYVTKAERERLAKAAAAFEKFNTGLSTTDGKPVVEPTLDLAEKPAKEEPKEEPKVETKAPEVKAEAPAKPATKPAESKPVAVTDAKAPEVKADAAKTAPKATTPAGNKSAPAGNQTTPVTKAPAKATGAAFGIK